MQPLRILIAEDSALFEAVLREVVSEEPDMTVLDAVGDGEQAVEKCIELEPDLVLMDIQMPRMDGLMATEHIMAQSPTPILVITSDPYRGGVDMSFKALSAGALDLMAKPTSLPWPDRERQEFLRKIRLLSQIPVIRHVRGSMRRRHVSFHGSRATDALGVEDVAVVGIVASTGGPKALARLLGDLPPGFPSPILVVQHIMRGFSQHLASWLDANSDLEVLEAAHGLRAEPGRVYVAPADHHLELGSGRWLEVHDAPPVGGHRPSGDVLLESLARRAPDRSLALVLSGMGSDGTMGLAAIHRAGGVTLVQDRESSVVYGMPQSAIDLGVVQNVVDLDGMAHEVVSQIRRIHQRIT